MRRGARVNVDYDLGPSGSGSVRGILVSLSDKLVEVEVEDGGLKIYGIPFRRVRRIIQEQ